MRRTGKPATCFHNGSARTLAEVVNFYKNRLRIGFTSDEIRDIVLFLQQQWVDLHEGVVFCGCPPARVRPFRAR